MRELLISGYGGAASIAKYRASDDWSEVERIWSDNIESPSFLSISGDMCFAVSEMGKSAAFFCYKKTSEGYMQTDKLAFDGGALCHLYYSPVHKTLYGACYHTGHLIAAAVEDYRFTGIRNLFVMQPEHAGELTRAHCCVPDPGGNRICVCNIAMDRVYSYNTENGSLIVNDAFPYIRLKKGEGPRHIVFHPLIDAAYVITEYSNKIFVMTYEKATGAMNVVQEISALPVGFSGRSFCSTLVFSQDGRFVYAANRGANTIAVFGAGEDGRLEKLQDKSCGGNWPRHISLTADGRFLVVANQESGDIAVITVSEKNGLLTGQAASIPFNAPSYAAEVK